MTDEISMWEWLKGHDVFTWLEPLWNGGGWYLNKDGKLEIIRSMIAIDTPWVHHGHTKWANCLEWSRVIFEHISRNIKKHFSDGEAFVPSGCQNCYKVVVRPQTLIQLFALDELEKNLGHPSKCGIEVRDSVGALYGGYFYNQSLEEGKACYKKVRAAVDDDKLLGPEVPVILKRACTEMEHLVGPSDKWKISEEQKVIEELVSKYLVTDKDEMDQPDPVVWRVKRKWIEWAFSHGDQTYKKFTGGKPVSPAYVTYHGQGQ